MSTREICMYGHDWGSSMVGLKIRCFTMRQTGFKTASSKVVKHEKTYFNNQHVFIHF